MSNFLDLTSGSTAQDIYSYSLRTAYIRGKRIWRPSFAEFSDPEIHVKIMRDPVIAHAIQYRKHLVAGARWNCEPFDNSPINKKAAAIMEKILKCISRFVSSRFNLANAIIRGSAIAFIEGDSQPIDVDGKQVMFWTPTRLRDIDTYRLRQSIGTDGEVFWEISTVDTKKNVIWDRLNRPELFLRHVYEDIESSLNYGRGLLEAIFYFYYFKQELLELGLKGAERWAMGIIDAGIDSLRQTVAATASDAGATSSTIATQWLDTLDAMRTHHALIHDKADEMKIITGGMEGHQMIDNFIKYFDNALRTLILGANLPTSASEGGSYALGAIQENSTHALVQFDRELLAETLTRYLIAFAWRMNRPQFAMLGLSTAQMPRFAIVDEKTSDPEKEIQVLTGVNQIAAIRKDEFYQRVGLSMPDTNDEVIPPRQNSQQLVPQQLDLGLDSNEMVNRKPSFNGQ